MEWTCNKEALIEYLLMDERNMSRGSAPESAGLVAFAAYSNSVAQQYRRDTRPATQGGRRQFVIALCWVHVISQASHRRHLPRRIMLNSWCISKSYFRLTLLLQRGIAPFSRKCCSSLVEADFLDQGDRGAAGEPQRRQDRGQPVRAPSHVLSQNFTVADSDTRRASPIATFRLLTAEG
jgi:hypothetical protein